MEKKLYRSPDDKVLAGVCGGLGEYFNLDPVIVRLIVVVFTLMGGAGLIAYIIAAIIIPERNNGKKNTEPYVYDGGETHSQEGSGAGESGKNSGNRLMALGIILIILGAFVLLRGFAPWISGETILAVFLIGLGIYFVIIRARQ